MGRKTLKFLRLLMPGLIAMALLIPIKNNISILYDSKLPFDLGILEFPAFALIIGVVYYILGLRYYFNAKFHGQVKQNITNRLWRAARKTDQPAGWDDKKARDTFYRLVDNDNTLTARTDIIYFNGLIWTSIADTRAISVLLSFLAIGMLLSNINSDSAVLLLAINVAAAAGSFPLSRVVTARHIHLGNKQLDYIENQLAPELDKYISNYGL